VGPDIQDELIRVDLPRHQPFPQSPGGLQHHLRIHTGQRVDREKNTGDMGRDHLLYHNSQLHLFVGQPVLLAIGPHPVVPCRGPAPAQVFFQRLPAHYVQVGFILSCETRLRKVLHDARGPDRHGPSLKHLLVQIPYLLEHVLGKRKAGNRSWD